jgi:uncharacterized protein YegJ (DUF2314 family)
LHRRVWIALALFACRPHDERARVVTPPPVAAKASAAPTSALRAPRAIVSFGIYGATPQRELARALAQKAGFEVADAPPRVPSAKPTLLVLTPSVAEVPPPDTSSLQYRGRGLTKADEARLQNAAALTALAFDSPSLDAARSYHAAIEIAREVARRANGFVYDVATRAVYTPDSFGKLLEGWTALVPDVRAHVTLDMYRDGELARIVSLGMEKLALPDVAVSQVSLNDSRAMGNLINLVLQTMIERGALDRTGELDVSVRSLRSAALRESLSTNWKKGATGTATVHLASAAQKDGDAENRLLELTFPGEGALQTRQTELVARVFGADDGLTMARDDDAELLAASRRAKAALAKLKPRLTPRPPELQQLMVKAPFTTTSGGVEWMWVEVVRWEGRKIQGILENDPYEVKGLKAGARVEVDEDALFDFILRRQDGTTEGNETGKILQARER